MRSDLDWHLDSLEVYTLAAYMKSAGKENIHIWPNTTLIGCQELPNGRVWASFEKLLKN